MSSDKVNLNPAMSQKAMAEFQRTYRKSDSAPGEKAEPVVDNIGFKKAPPARDQFEASEDVRTLEEMKALLAIGRAEVEKTPDYNAERLEEVRERIINGDYDTPRIRVDVSRNLARVMKLLEVFTT